MNDQTPALADVLPWAEQMVRMGARACVVSQMTGLPTPAARKMWLTLNGVSSPSGQQPNDLLWYLRNPTRRFHSALLVQLCERARNTLPEHAAITHAYYHYAHLTASRPHVSGWQPQRGVDPAFRPGERDYEIPFARADYLLRFYTDEKLTNGRRKCPLICRRCTRCGSIYMAADTEGGAHHCPLCS